VNPYLKRTTSGIATEKVVAGVPMLVSTGRKLYIEGSLDRQTDVVVPREVHSKLYTLDSRRIDNVGWEGSELAVTKRWCRTGGWNRARVIERPLAKRYDGIFFPVLRGQWLLLKTVRIYTREESIALSPPNVRTFCRVFVFALVARCGRWYTFQQGASEAYIQCIPLCLGWPAIVAWVALALKYFALRCCAECNISVVSNVRLRQLSAFVREIVCEGDLRHKEAREKGKDMHPAQVRYGSDNEVYI
jgi:hypothetical protein